ncbi:M20/M25/M40 family metallo-hydrolase [Burkholderia gladioli]|nr:M20/M25/M40 family metallo-hydrolase [Burkholderia gladioli]MBU9681915.1 M20/M25/M40 family metallo-hydrolase [Burkholderia gladioli]
MVNADRWTKDPAGEVCGKRLYGLGVSDMKGGVAAIVFAMRHLSQIRASFAGEIVATLVGDEESMGEEGTAWLLSNVAEAKGDAMISADTGSPQILRFGEKGMIWLRLSACGKSSHAAHVHKGISAIDRLLRVLHDIRYIENLPVEAPDAVTAEILKAADVSERISGGGRPKSFAK